MKFWGIGVAVLVSIAGCSSSEDRIAFEGQYFKAKARKVEKQRDVFTVSVKGVSRSLDGARQAAEYEGTKYCVSYFGSSDIYWTVGPDTPATSLPIENDTLTYQGRCPQARPAKTGG